MGAQHGWNRWVSVTVVLALFASIAVWWFRSDEATGIGPTLGDVPPVGVVVALTRPGGGHAPAMVGFEAALDVEVVSEEPIRGIEVWAGDRVLAAVTLDGDQRSTTRRLTFAPTVVGHLVFVARAVDQSGRVGQSAALRLAVTDPYAPAIMTSVAAIEGESLADVAARTGADLEVVRAMNPALPAEGALPVDARVDVAVLGPVLDGPLPPEAIPPELRDLAPSGADEEPGGDPAEVSQATPDGPQLRTSVDGCQLTVSAVGVSSDADGLAVHLLGPNTDHFTIVATIPTDGTWEALLGPGDHTVAVSAYSDHGHVWSAPANVTLPDRCRGEHDGEVDLADGRLTGGAAADLAYLYVSVDGDTWRRVPEHPWDFVPRTGDHFDFARYLPDFVGQTLELDAWGWLGSELVHIGRGSVTVPFDLDLNVVTGASQAVWLGWIDEDAGDGRLRSEVRVTEPAELTFSWSTGIADVDRATWQVTSSPPDGDSIEPADLLAEGELEGAAGEFTIDFVRLPKPWPEPLGSPTDASEDVGADAVDFLPEQYYVRVVPFAGDRYVGRSSSPVSVTVGRSLSEIFADLDLGPREFEMTLQVDPPRAPNLWRTYCFQLVGWDADKVDQRAFAAARDTASPMGLTGPAFGYYIYLTLQHAFGPDIPLCSGSCYEVGSSRISLGGGGCDRSSPLEQIGSAFVSVFVALWDDMIVFAFNELKAFVVETIAEFGGCNLLVGAVGGAVGDVSQEQAKAWCETAANAVVTAVMAAYGIPPTLPTSSDLIEAAKGDLTALAVEYAKSLGVPCDELGDASAAGGVAGQDIPTCEELMRDLIDEFQDAVNDQFRHQAAAFGVGFPPGAVVVPHPDGQIKPARVKVLVEPTPEPYETCPVMLLSHASWVPGPDDLVTVTTTNPWRPRDGATSTLLAEANVGYRVRFPPARFSGAPFLPVTRQLPARGEEVLVGIPGNLRQVTGASMRMFETGWYPPVSVEVARYAVGGTDWRAREIPYHSLLLHPGGAFEVLALSSCAGVAKASVTVPGLP
jgi:hypothetical protein